MERCDLVAAVRLPNNLFTDHAGTEVGSDAYRPAKELGRPPPLRTAAGLYQNAHALERHYGRQQLPIARPRGARPRPKWARTPTGNRQMEFTHAGGVKASPVRWRICSRRMMERHFNRELYESHAPEDRSASVQGTAERRR